jgi:hypothetical protein
VSVACVLHLQQGCNIYGGKREQRTPENLCILQRDLLSKKGPHGTSETGKGYVVLRILGPSIEKSLADKQSGDSGLLEHSHVRLWDDVPGVG